MIDIDIQISISERSSGWATNYRNACVNYMKHRHRKRKANKNIGGRNHYRAKLSRSNWGTKCSQNAGQFCKGAI